jgi:hypothetical protein
LSGFSNLSLASDLAAIHPHGIFAALAMTADYAFGSNPPYGLIQHRHYATRKEAKRGIFDNRQFLAY